MKTIEVNNDEPPLQRSLDSVLSHFLRRLGLARFLLLQSPVIGLVVAFGGVSISCRRRD